MSDDDRNARIADIVRERAASEREGDLMKVAHCDAELRRLGPQRTSTRQAAQTRGA